MGISRQNILEHMQRFRNEVTVSKCWFGERTPVPNMLYQSMPFPRILLPLVGVTPLSFAMQGEERKREFVPGEILFLGPFCWSAPDWHAGQETLSIVFMNNSFLRIIYLASDVTGPWKDVNIRPKDYYHIEDSLSNCTVSIIRALESFDPNVQEEETGIQLVNCLVNSALSDLERSKEVCFGKALQTWHMISEYIQDKFTEKLSRNNVAEAFHITPGHLSYLFKRFSGGTFSEYLNRLRLAHAANLLVETDMFLDEIAWKTGYNSTSYFIRLFSELYLVSPTTYRKDKRGD